ncbi:hypothetical protein [Salipiger aestuarii]|uniref:hypothetical protein n=1 Tax=Salipiger aestuarii TaxID=568098 RepID=UPI0012386460|nr:hypothetical protein [Salipiger aestuarii]KAA8614271.1 hypothetical protein AL037_03555 [Salipiger aestuarii]
MSTGQHTYVTLGCDPTVTVEIVEDAGNLWLSVTSDDPANTDIDGLFFNFTNDAVIGDLHINPEYSEDIGSNGENITGFEASVGTLNQLNNGAQVQGQYDCKIEFGTEAYTTGGDVDQAAMTFWIDGAEGLTIDDIDLNSLTCVVNSETGTGLALTNPDASGSDDAAYETTVAAEDDFNDIHYAWQSDIVAHSGNWYATNGELAANGCNDGNLWFDKVDVDGKMEISFDARAPHTEYFENGGWAGDSLEVWVLIDGSQWELLDTFEVNAEGDALVGDTTGQQITADSTTLSYSGGALDDAETVQMVIGADFTSANEQVFIDNVEFLDTTETVISDDTETVETEVASEDFDSSDHFWGTNSADMIKGWTDWDVRNGELNTDGSDDGHIWFDQVDTGGNDAKIAMDARAPHTEYFENGGYGGDSLQVWALVDGSDWEHLDTFTVNDTGTALVGDKTGQEINSEKSSLEWTEGLETASSVQLYMYSDISSSGEDIYFDNLTVSTLEEVPVEGGGPDDSADDCAQYLLSYDDYGKLAQDAEQAALDGSEAPEDDVEEVMAA